MGDLDKALTELSHIRRPRHLSADVQARWVALPAEHIGGYLAVWIATAAVSAALIVVQMQTRARRMHSAMADEMIRMAIEQFLPALIAGLLVTVVLAEFVTQAVWMLPGVWQLIYSLGVFSSCRFLPRLVMVGGAWYLLTALVCLGFGDARALSPWTMGLAYGAGQMLIAAALYAGAEGATDEE